MSAMSLRAKIHLLSKAQCNDQEIQLALSTPLWYVRQCLNRAKTQGRYRRTPPINQPQPACYAAD